MNAARLVGLMFGVVLSACASTSGATGGSGNGEGDSWLSVCGRIARVSFECPEDYVDTVLSIEAERAPGGQKPPSSVRADRLRLLREQRDEPPEEQERRCSAEGERLQGRMPSGVENLGACEQKAACSLKVKCLRPLLEARPTG